MLTAQSNLAIITRKATGGRLGVTGTLICSHQIHLSTINDDNGAAIMIRLCQDYFTS